MGIKFDDFYITIMPLQYQEVRGCNDLGNFSCMLLAPPKYKYWTGFTRIIKWYYISLIKNKFWLFKKILEG